MESTNQSSQTVGERHFAILMACWLLFVLCSDLLTLSWFPVPWIDEIMFSDPAISLIREGHWTSTAWCTRADLTYWAGNAPLYSGLLCPWLEIFGPESASVRSFNCVLAALVFGLAWVAIKRLRLIDSPLIRFSVLAALSWSYPISYNVRCGRPDLTGMMLMALAALAWFSPSATTARRGLVLTMIFLPFAGLHYVFYMPVVLGVLFWHSTRDSRSKVGAIVLGGLIGGILFFAYHQWFAGWDSLLTSMADVRSRRDATPLINAAQLLKTLVTRYYFGRPHFLLLFAVCSLLWVLARKLDAEAKKSLRLATLFLIVPGICVGLGAHFGVPYHWLAVVPATLFLGRCAAKSWPTLGAIPRLLCIGATVALGLSGRPVFLGVGLLLDSAGYTRKIESVARQVTQPSDIAYGDWQVYYALKPRVQRIYFPYIVPRLEMTEKKAVTVAFLPAGQLDATTWLGNTFGGEWRQVDLLPTPSRLPFRGNWVNGFSPSYFFGNALATYRRTIPDSLPSSPVQ